MTPEQFSAAAAEMQERGVIVAGHGWKTDLAAKMGWTLPTVINFEKRGTARVETDYAIAALLAGVPPYPAQQ